MKKYLFKLLIINLLTISISNSFAQNNPKIPVGLWRATLQISKGQQELPFGLETKISAKGQIEMYLLNGKERILLSNIKQNGDSVIIPMHIFDAAIKAKLSDKNLIGVYRKYDTNNPDYSLPFTATFNQTQRFKKEKNAEGNVNGRWSVLFKGENSTDTTQAIGLFEQKSDGVVTGTFLTNTGDYRFLEGQLNGNLLQLSCFDGSHAFLFTAEVQGQKLVNGHFWAGISGHETWTANYNEKAILPDASTLTYLKKGHTKLDFSFPDLNGKKISLSDDKFKNKAVIVQLLGSWCPNCMDETKFLSNWYKRQDPKKVAIIGLGFERKKDFDYAKGRLEILKKRFAISYDLLVAGISNKDSAAAVLPALSHVLAFPTTIFIDKKGNVSYIHTGFSGPGTGAEYDKFVEDFEKKMKELMK